MRYFIPWMKWGRTRFTLHLRYSYRIKYYVVKSGKHSGQRMSTVLESKRPGKFPVRKVTLCFVVCGCCIILLKSYISHPLPHPSQFHSQKCLQNDATALRMYGKGLVVFSRRNKARSYQCMNIAPNHYLFIMQKFLVDLHRILSVYVTGQVEESLI